MNLQLSGHNLHLSPANKQLVFDKLNLPLDKLLVDFAPDLKIASVIISKDKYEKYTVNFDMNLPGKTHIFATAQHLLLESALIDLAQEIEKQIKKHKQDLVNYSLG